MIDVLLAVLLGGLLTGVPLTLSLVFVTQEAARARETAQARAVAHQTYITELQNRLFAHTWGEFSQLQNEVATHTGQTAAVLNSFGEPRAEEAWGENVHDRIEHLMADLGTDLEGPTVG